MIINFFHADEIESFCDRQDYEQHLANKRRELKTAVKWTRASNLQI